MRLEKWKKAGCAHALRRRAACAFAAAACAAALAGCGHASHDASQVVATVGDKEITVSEVNAALAGLGPLPPQQAAAARKHVIDGLIDQELASGEALSRKLDQTPDVVVQLELARKQVLAKAYAEQVASYVTAPGDDQARAYYAQHPELFSDRRVYKLEQVGAQGGAAVATALQQQLDAGKTLEQIGAWLKAQNIPASTDAATKPAEQIPLELLARLTKLQPGQSLVQQGGGAVQALRLVQAAPAPVDEAQALPVIKQALLNQARKDAIDKGLAALRQSAKIVYASAPAAPASAAAH